MIFQELFGGIATELKNRFPFGAVSKFKKQTISGQRGSELLSACINRYNSRITPIGAIIIIIGVLISTFFEGTVINGGQAEIVGEIILIVNCVFALGIGIYFKGRYPAAYIYVFWLITLSGYAVKLTGCITGAAGFVQTVFIILALCAIPIFPTLISTAYMVLAAGYYTVLCVINGISAYYPFMAFVVAVTGVIISANNYCLYCSRMINSKRIREDSEKIKLSSRLDRATGVYTREYGIGCAAEIMSQSRAGLLLVDLDNFGEYNRAFGTQRGDKALRDVANCIKIISKPYTDVVCHLESDKLLVCLGIETEKDAVLLSEEIRSSIVTMNIPFKSNEKFGAVTVTVGVAISNPGMDFDALFEKAMLSVNEGKSAGGNCICYEGHVFNRN